MLGVAPFGGAGTDEDVRDLLGVEVFVDRGVGRGAERVEHDFIALDELAYCSTVFGGE
jgi:hypothetical protein